MGRVRRKTSKAVNQWRSDGDGMEVKLGAWRYLLRKTRWVVVQILGTHNETQARGIPPKMYAEFKSQHQKNL